MGITINKTQSMGPTLGSAEQIAELHDAVRDFSRIAARNAAKELVQVACTEPLEGLGGFMLGHVITLATHFAELDDADRDELTRSLVAVQDRLTV